MKAKKYKKDQKKRKEKQRKKKETILVPFPSVYFLWYFLGGSHNY